MAASVGDIVGPILDDGKYSVIYVIDKVESSPRDFLSVKQQIASRIMSNEENERFKQWVKERKEQTKIAIDTEVLWSTVDREKYASADTTAAGVAGN